MIIQLKVAPPKHPKGMEPLISQEKREFFRNREQLRTYVPGRGFVYQNGTKKETLGK